MTELVSLTSPDSSSISYRTILLLSLLAIKRNWSPLFTGTMSKWRGCWPSELTCWISSSSPLESTLKTAIELLFKLGSELSLLLAYMYRPLFDTWISPAAISELSSFSRRVEIVKNGAKFPRSSDCSEVIVEANSETKKKKSGFSEEMSFL